VLLSELLVNDLALLLGAQILKSKTLVHDRECQGEST
jgi:hypothetical protein